MNRPNDNDGVTGALDSALDSLMKDLANGDLDITQEAAQAALDALPPELRVRAEQVRDAIGKRDAALEVPQPDDMQLERNMIVYNSMPENQRDVLKHCYETQMACGMVINDVMPGTNPKLIAYECSKAMTAMLHIILTQAAQLQE